MNWIKKILGLKAKKQCAISCVVGSAYYVKLEDMGYTCVVILWVGVRLKFNYEYLYIKEIL